MQETAFLVQLVRKIHCACRGGEADLEALSIRLGGWVRGGSGQSQRLRDAEAGCDTTQFKQSVDSTSAIVQRAAKAGRNGEPLALK
eukprot:3937377-Rhodomonas_salina.1